MLMANADVLVVGWEQVTGMGKKLRSRFLIFNKFSFKTAVSHVQQEPLAPTVLMNVIVKMVLAAIQ